MGYVTAKKKLSSQKIKQGEAWNPKTRKGADTPPRNCRRDISAFKRGSCQKNPPSVFWNASALSARSFRRSFSLGRGCKCIFASTKRRFLSRRKKTSLKSCVYQSVATCHRKRQQDTATSSIFGMSIKAALRTSHSHNPAPAANSHSGFSHVLHSNAHRPSTKRNGHRQNAAQTGATQLFTRHSYIQYIQCTLTSTHFTTHAPQMANLIHVRRPNRS